MAALTPSPAPRNRHRAPASRRRIIVTAGSAVAVLIAIVVGVVLASGPSTPKSDPLGTAVAGIAGSKQVKILSQDATLARNCTKPDAQLPAHGTLAMVWPGEITAGLVGSDTIENYAPTVTHHHGYTLYTWTLNPLQTVTTATFSVRTAPGLCSTALKMHASPGGPFSLGNGSSKPTILLVARVMAGTTIQWAQIIAVNRPLK